MKIILNDVYWKGRHIDHYECEMPGVKNADEIPEDRIIEYIIESLEALDKLSKETD